jgi:AhpD family alkylhydroperoxidase
MTTHADKRLNYRHASPEGFAAMLNLASTLHASSIPTVLRALVEIRVSQINGCAFCLDMHATEARQAGATQRQLDLVAAWQEADCFDERERAALAWAEAVTLIRETRAPRELYDEARRHFSDRELADLTLIVTTMNAWNRLNVALRVPPAPARP